jgi:hypothetical protein
LDYCSRFQPGSAIEIKSRIHILLLIITVFSILEFIPLSYASQNDPYESGYDHGCDDAEISDPSERYINQPGKGPSFHTGNFMSGYNDGFDACSDGIGDNNNAENNAVDGNLRVIATLDMGTYGNQYCDSRTFDMRVYVQSKLAQEKIVGACDGQETTFIGLNVDSDSSFRVCAYGNDLELSGCRTAVNGPEPEPERVTVSVS